MNVEQDAQDPEKERDIEGDHNSEGKEGESEDDKDNKDVSPNDIRVRLLKEKRKKFARKWYTKFNAYKKNLEQLEISKRGRASSGIGEERIK